MVFREQIRSQHRRLPSPAGENRVATTRSVYQRKLARLLRNESFNESEDNAGDEEVRPTPLHSTLLYSPGASYKSSPPYYSTPSPSI
ncbi:hypothetical protein NPIL_625391, partial [Nephila pilipes]